MLRTGSFPQISVAAIMSVTTPTSSVAGSSTPRTSAALPHRSGTRQVAVPSAAPPTSTGTTLGIMVVVVGALYFGQDILMPVALAVLLSFALAPVVVRLRRWGLGRNR